MARTSEEIVSEMMENLPDEFNKSVGTVVYDMEKPAAIEVSYLEQQQDEILNNAFFDTADENHKVQIAYDRAGITRKPATKAHGYVTFTGEEDTVIPAGSLVASELSVFSTVEECTIGSGGTVDVEVECVDAGTSGNVPAETVTDIPVTIPGVVSVINEQMFVGGDDIESISSLTDRYYATIRNGGYSGNPAHYEMWAEEITDVGEAKCFARTPTIGSVTTYITDRSGRAADADLIAEVHAYIETQRPCPATSIVTAPTEQAVDVEAAITVSSGQPADYTTAVTAAVQNYINGIGFKGNRRVSYALVGDAVLSVDGVVDYDDLTINGEQRSLVIGNTEIVYFNSYTEAGD